MPCAPPCRQRPFIKGRDDLRVVRFGNFSTRYCSTRFPKPQITRPEPLKRDPISAHNLSPQRLGGSDQPRIIFTHSPAGTTLQESAPTRLSQMKPLNRKALERRQRRRFVHGSLKQLFHADDRDYDFSS